MLCLFLAWPIKIQFRGLNDLRLIYVLHKYSFRYICTCGHIPDKVNCNTVCTGELGGGGGEPDQHAEGAEHHEIQVRPAAGPVSHANRVATCYFVLYIT